MKQLQILLITILIFAFNCKQEETLNQVQNSRGSNQITGSYSYKVKDEIRNSVYLEFNKIENSKGLFNIEFNNGDSIFRFNSTKVTCESPAPQTGEFNCKLEDTIKMKVFLILLFKGYSEFEIVSFPSDYRDIFIKNAKFVKD